MAITPNEAKKKAVQNEQKLKVLEKRIADTLVREFKKSHEPVWIEADIFPNDLVMKTVMNRYRTAGWCVKYESGSECGYQRDPDYVVFKPKK